MLKYTIGVPGARTMGGRVAGAAVGDILRTVADGAAGALRGFSRLFRRDNIQRFVMRNGRPQFAPLELDPERLQAVARLRQRTPAPRRVKVAGRVDEARYSRCAFVLDLEDGGRVAAVLAEYEPDSLKPHFGELVVIEGVAQFRPSGRLLRVDVDRIGRATSSDLKVFAREPRPLDAKLVGERQRLSRGAGFASIVGTWPGDETDEQVAVALNELS